MCRPLFCRPFVRVIVFLLLGGALPTVWAESTELRILVRATDAKFIGTGVGGMNVHVSDVDSGAVLDSGQISGGTGDTAALMKVGQTRGAAPAGDGVAGFTAELDIERPTQVRVSVTGPLAVAASRQHISTTLWVVPGRHQVEPGVVLQLPGLMVDVVKAARKGDRLSVSVHVTMMCGCPVTREGLWSADDFEVVAQIYQDNTRIHEVPLAFTGTVNEFSGDVSLPESGDYEMVVYAFQKSTGNTGVDQYPLSQQ